MPEEDVPSEVRAFLEEVRPEFRSLVSTMREVVLAARPDLEEAIKWRRLTFTLDGNWHHWICAIGASKTAVALYFHKGSLLDDPDEILSGDGKYTRKISGEDFGNVDAPVVAALMEDAVNRQTEMLDE